MTYLVLLVALIFLPVALIVALRVNAAIAFMSLCLGSVLVRYTAGDVGSIASGLSNKTPVSTNHIVNIGLLVAPFILTILFTRNSINAKKQFSNFFPAIASGLLFALMVTPLLPLKTQSKIVALHEWGTLSSLQTAVILAGAFFSLLFILISHRGHGGEEKKHDKH